MPSERGREVGVEAGWLRGEAPRKGAAPVDVAVGGGGGVERESAGVLPTFGSRSDMTAASHTRTDDARAQRRTRKRTVSRYSVRAAQPTKHKLRYN